MARYGSDANRKAKVTKVRTQAVSAGDPLVPVSVSVSRELSSVTGLPVYDNHALYYQTDGPAANPYLQAEMGDLTITVDSESNDIQGVITHSGPHPHGYKISGTTDSGDSLTMILVEW